MFRMRLTKLGKTFNVNLTQKAKFIFQPLSILIFFIVFVAFSLHISFPNGSQHLATIVVINRHSHHFSPLEFKYDTHVSLRIFL